jgi:hypothetical protein
MQSKMDVVEKNRT